MIDFITFDSKNFIVFILLENVIGRVGAIGEVEVEVINAVGGELLGLVGGLVQPNDWDQITQ